MQSANAKFATAVQLFQANKLDKAEALGRQLAPEIRKHLMGG